MNEQRKRMKMLYDQTYKFATLFDMESGYYVRAFGSKEDPFMAEYPHLIDVGVMGHCEHGKSGLCAKAGIECYQNGLTVNNPNMTLENYKKIVDESKNMCLEFALGGAGDVDMHENFEEILAYTRENNIIPNFTTSGLGLTKEKADICKKYCGAVAVSMYSRLEMGAEIVAWRKSATPRIYNSPDDIPVMFTLGNTTNEIQWLDGTGYWINGEIWSWDEMHHVPFGQPIYEEYVRIYDEKISRVSTTPLIKNGEIVGTFTEDMPNYTMVAINHLLNAGVKTNIHYVLNNKTIEEALIRLKYNGFPKGINAVVFLLHKPVGLGTKKSMLKLEDERVQEFFKWISDNAKNLPFKIGFDSCSIPAIINMTTSINPISVDTCEGGRFSMYITPDMKALPCSFDNQKQKFAVQMTNSIGIKQAWNSKQFDAFRYSLKNSCSSCADRELCMGGCPLCNDIVLCNRSCRNFCDTQEAVMETERRKK